jgi:3'(2'), 5'-bisphosphate nucleotidase
VEVVDVGSVGAKVNEVLAGRAEAYVHNTGFYEWDVAAPYGVALHYGLVPSHFDGSPVTFNHMPPYVTDLVVAHPDIAAALRSVLRT